LTFRSLNILDRTRAFLYPMVPLCIFYVVTLCIGWNLSRSLFYFYHYRVL
jgi:hypothetical protein